MYKCCECGQEYKNPVEYCDCGNNTFDEIEEFEPIIKTSKRMLDKGEIVSWVFFATCVLLSLLVIFFVGNPKQTSEDSQSKKVVKTVVNNDIPSIDSFWNDTPIAVPKPKETITEVVEKELNKIVEPPFVENLFKTVEKVTKPQPVKTQAQPVKTQQPKVQTKVEPKKVEAKKIESKSTVSTPKPIVKQETTKPTVLANTKTTTNQNTTVKPVENKVENSISKPVTQTVTKPKVEVTNMRDPAVVSYKHSLLQKLFSRFVMSGIQGNGTCVVSFSISKDGKLNNRKFVKLSDNKSLNDAVYYMMMSVPTFNAPPAAYKGDVLNLQVKFYNGNYEFSYL